MTGEGRTKTEAERIAGVANVPDAESCLRYAQRAREAGMPALAAACEERANTLKPARSSAAGRTRMPPGEVVKARMKTQAVAEQALAMLVDDYKAGLDPTTYGELARRCGFEGQQNGRWFGQVTDLIDAACALADVSSFALVRVREANGNVNNAAWRKEYSHLRDRIIAKALAGKWAEEDFTKIHDALALFSRQAFGHKKAWEYVWGQIDMEAWAGAAR
jgi:hypothetical protein